MSLIPRYAYGVALARLPDGLALARPPIVPAVPGTAPDSPSPDSPPVLYDDGLVGAPSGAPQWPGILDAYVARPAWNVAGVDYHVGIDRTLYPTNASLKNPTSAALPAGCSRNTTTHVWTITGDDVVVDGWDFSLNGGWFVTVDGGSNGVIKNCNFKVTTPSQSGPLYVSNLATNYSIMNNEIDGNGTLNQAIGIGLFTSNGQGTTTVKYNWIKSAYGIGISFSSVIGNEILDIRYNLIEDAGIGFSCGAHGDWIQCYNATGSPVGPSTAEAICKFNLWRQTIPIASGRTQGLSLFSANSGPTSGGCEIETIENNCFIANNDAYVNFAIIVDTTRLITSASLKDNYFDPTNIGSANGGGGDWSFIGNYNGASGGPYNGSVTKTGNTNMLDGTLLDGSAPDSPPVSPDSPPITTGTVVFGPYSLAVDDPESNLTLRHVITPSLFINGAAGATQVRIRHHWGVSSGGACETQMYFGRQAASGDAYDFDGKQVPVTWGGLTHNAQVSNQQVTSDWINLPSDQPFDPSKTYLVSFQLDGSPIVLKIGTGMSGQQGYFAAGVLEAGATTVFGYSATSAGILFFIEQIEVGDTATPPIDETGPGPFDGTALWPNTTNRPTVSGGVLSFVGPASGGATSTSDVRQSVTLTPSGSVSTTSNNQIIQNLDISGSLTILHNNVTVRRCRIKTSSTNGTMIVMNNLTTGSIFEDCEVDGSMNTYCGWNVPVAPSWGNAIIRRCYIHGMENGITGNPSNLSVLDCLLGPWGNAGNASCDSDGIELYASDNILIRHNTFDAAGSQTTNIGLNSCLNLSNLGPVTNVTVDNNHFNNTGEFGSKICDDNRFTAGAVQWSCTNNGFINIGSLNYRLGHSTPSPNSGNYGSNNVNAHLGVLVDGTGVLPGNDTVTDGTVGAPVGATIPHPTLLDAYPNRPPWNVAGVDYGVGPHSGITFKDPTVTPPAGTSYSNPTLGVLTDNVVIDGYDLTKNNGVKVFCDHNNLTISNCLIGGSNYANDGAGAIYFTGQNITVKNCWVNMRGAATSGGTATTIMFLYPGFGATDTSGNVVLQYNYFSNYTQHIIELLNSAHVDYRFNFIDDTLVSPGAHMNWLQWSNNDCYPVVKFNTARQVSLNAAEGFQFYTTTTLPALAQDNYVDPTSLIVPGTSGKGLFYPGSFAGWTITGNIDMRNGNPMNNAS